MPTFIYFFFRWRFNRIDYTFLELLCIYGYSLTIFIPVSILWIIPIHWLQWTLTITASLVSGSVLIVIFWSSVNTSEQKHFSAISILVLLLAHLLMAICIMLVFFHISDKNINLPSETTSMTSLTSSLVPSNAKKV
jgi:protein YIPF1/2